MSLQSDIDIDDDFSNIVMKISKQLKVDNIDKKNKYSNHIVIKLLKNIDGLILKNKDFNLLGISANIYSSNKRYGYIGNINASYTFEFALFRSKQYICDNIKEIVELINNAIHDFDIAKLNKMKKKRKMNNKRGNTRRKTIHDVLGELNKTCEKKRVFCSEILAINDNDKNDIFKPESINRNNIEKLLMNRRHIIVNHIQELRKELDEFQFNSLVDTILNKPDTLTNEQFTKLIPKNAILVGQVRYDSGRSLSFHPSIRFFNTDIVRALFLYIDSNKILLQSFRDNLNSINSDEKFHIMNVLKSFEKDFEYSIKIGENVLDTRKVQTKCSLGKCIEEHHELYKNNKSDQIYNISSINRMIGNPTKFRAAGVSIKYNKKKKTYKVLRHRGEILTSNRLVRKTIKDKNVIYANIFGSGVINVLGKNTPVSNSMEEKNLFDFIKSFLESEKFDFIKSKTNNKVVKRKTDYEFIESKKEAYDSGATYFTKTVNDDCYCETCLNVKWKCTTCNNKTDPMKIYDCEDCTCSKSNSWCNCKSCIKEPSKHIDYYTRAICLNCVKKKKMKKNINYIHYDNENKHCKECNSELKFIKTPFPWYVPPDVL